MTLRFRLLVAPLVLLVIATVSPARAAEGDAAVAGADIAYRFAVAKALAAEGDLAAAAAELRGVVEQVPDDPWLRLEYATLLADLAATAPSPQRAAEHLEEASRQAQRAVELDPENLESWRVLAQTRLAVAGDDADALGAAVDALERVLASAPDDARTALTLARIYLGTGRSDRAVGVLERLSEMAAGNPFVDRMLGQALVAAGRNPEGEEVLARILAMEPDDREMRLELARVQAERGDHAAALATLDEAPAEQREGPMFRRRRALELYFLGRYDEAVALIDEVLAEGAAEVTQSGVKALALAAQDRQEEFDRLLAEMGPDLPVHRELARMLEARGSAAQAERVLRRLVARLEAGEGEPTPEGAPPAAAVARDDLARLLAHTGRPAEAAAVLEPLLTVEPPDLRRIAALTQAGYLHEAGRTDEALALLEGLEADRQVQAVTLDLLLSSGRERRAHKLLRRMAGSADEATVLAAARVAQGNQRFELSMPLLESLVERTGSPEALFSLGAAYERSGRLEDSVATFRRLLAAHPDDDRALNYLGYLWVDRGENLAEALELIRRAVAAAPDEGAYVDSLGWAHYQLGEYELALKYLQRAALLVPDDPEVFEHLGDVHRRLGDDRRAREFYLRAMALAEGGDDDLRQKLDELSPE
jgi:tetratricopeptide (TPR) repeat protein